MKHLAKRLFKKLEEENGAVPNQVDTEIPSYKEIEDHNQAKRTMKNYLEKVMEDIEESIDLTMIPETAEAIRQAKEILNSPKIKQSHSYRKRLFSTRNAKF